MRAGRRRSGRLVRRRICCEVEYLGTAYAGFQRQPNKVTVQASLELALQAITGAEVPVMASGRTDAGAHACRQVIAFDTDSHLSADVLQRALNAHLPHDVAVVSASEATVDFNPRFDASSRVYHYLIWNRPVRSPFWVGRAAHVRAPLDETAMDRAAQMLVGRHDFSSFVPTQQDGSRERTMFAARCTRSGHLVQVELEASGFMKQMVRSIVGLLLRVGLGKLDDEGVQTALKAVNREAGGDTAPACGLYLHDVRYRSPIDGGRTSGPH